MAHVKLERIETSICPISDIKLSTSIFGLLVIEPITVRHIFVLVRYRYRLRLTLETSFLRSGFLGTCWGMVLHANR